MRRRLWRGGALAALAAALLAACSGADPLDDPDAGRALAYDPEALRLDLEALPVLVEEAPGLQVFAAFPPDALVFEAAEGGQEARYQLAITVRDEASGRVVREQVRLDTLRVDRPEDVRGAAVERLEAALALAPGTYRVEARLEDLGTLRVGAQRLRVDVPAVGGAAVTSQPLVEVKRNGRYVPHLARTLAAPSDSLRVRVAVWNLPAGATTALRVERLPSDTTVARPPHWLGPSRGSLAYQGVRMTDAEVVYAAPAQPSGGAAYRALAFAVPPLKEGLYRLAAETRGGEEAEPAPRYLAVFPASSPRFLTLDRLVDALAYIAYERELDVIRAGATAAERRARFDEFWGTLIGDRRVAGNVLRLYYERVEEATRRYSTVKEGWKTDRGMIFVLLGPPNYVEQEPDGETWYYGAGLRQDAVAVEFERVEGFGQPAGWQPYVLRRGAAYEALWASSLRRWRRGQVY